MCARASFSPLGVGVQLHIIVLIHSHVPNSSRDNLMQAIGFLPSRLEGLHNRMHSSSQGKVTQDDEHGEAHAHAPLSMHVRVYGCIKTCSCAHFFLHGTKVHALFDPQE
jgi:hypothetical protein